MKKLVTHICVSAICTTTSLVAATPSTPLWHHIKNDSIYGVGYDMSLKFIKNVGAEPKKEIIAAVIDGGIDFSINELKPYVWNNPKEVVGNGIDDDKNGYIDDIHGWNFIGNAKGDLIFRTGTAEFREHKRLRSKYKNVDPESIKPKQKAEFEHYKKMTKMAGITSYEMYEKYLEAMYEMALRCDSLMHECYGDDAKMSVNDFYNIQLADTVGHMKDLNGMAMSLLSATKEDDWSSVVESHKAKYDEAHERVLSLDNPNEDPHIKAGNDPLNFRNFKYGNDNILASEEDALHGTLVSALVSEAASVCGAQVKIMGIRAVGDGDEYDRDICAAIYYAVKNGAKVINCSFGKKSPEQQEEVAKALRYAERKDVVVVRAAGNNGTNNDTIPNYPTSISNRGRKFQNVIVVGASDEKGIKGGFSNFGKSSVDVFAPGVAITSHKPAEGTMTANGTSFSSPIVAAIATTIRSYYPDLSAEQVVDILKGSVRLVKTKDNLVTENCIAGGVVDAEVAMRLANEMSKFGL